jgi:hypothetical protein
MIASINNYFRIIFMAVTVIFAYSCKKDTSSDIGKDFLAVHSNIMMIDTFTVSLSSYKYDSIPTSGAGLSLVGNYQDEDLGKVESSSYFEIGLPTSSQIAIGSTFDSLTLVLKYNGTYVGDTTAIMDMNVYQLQEAIIPRSDGLIYNSSSFNYDKNGGLLGTTHFFPKPKTGNYIEIRLKNDMGVDLFNKLSSNALEIRSSSNFLQYFHGMVLGANGASNAAILGFAAADTGTYVKLYYTSSSTGSLTQSTIKFPIYETAKQFNQIRSDRSGTSLAALSGQHIMLRSSQTNHRSYLQAGVGIVSRIDFPYLSSLPNLGRYGSILKAELLIQPVIKSYDIVNLPQKLVLYTTDLENEKGTTINAISGSSEQTGNLYMDDIYKLNTHYTFDITSYLRGVMNSSSYQQSGLLLFPYNLNSSLERLFVADQSDKNNKITLKVYYLLYED